jgi:DNA-binding NtrC family response regulator
MNKRVLFIDDQFKDWEGLMRKGLDSFGFDLKGEEDPWAVLKVIESFKPDVVLLDIVFPGGNLGKPTLENIKKKYPNLPVMMITSTMTESAYNAEDYALADYRYAKAALTEGDFQDLAFQLDTLIKKAKTKKKGKEDDGGLSRLGFIVGKTKFMKEVAEIIEKVAENNSTVLIQGESGTGKKLIAQAIHKLSSRNGKPFVVADISTYAKTLVQDELFGHEPGAFTGATRRKKGRFELANGGTIFLDEIGEIPTHTQLLLLRVLQERQFERVGGEETVELDVRIIAATNRNLNKEMTEGRFREDLYFRLNTVPIHIPPLRERKEDIPLFFEHFIEKANKEFNKKILLTLRNDVKERLQSNPWPGNIRQLENFINRAVTLADENILQISNFPGLSKKDAEDDDMSSNKANIANQIFNGSLTWADFTKEFKTRSNMGKEVLLQIIDRWQNTHQTRPSIKELAVLFNVTEPNMRQILHVCGIKLSRIEKKLSQ